MSDSLIINAGSDLELTFTWPSGVAAGADCHAGRGF